jgi:hypothetical protein
MVELIVYSFVLALIALWLWPLIFNIKNLDYLVSNRDDPATESVPESQTCRCKFSGKLSSFFSSFNIINSSRC